MSSTDPLLNQKLGDYTIQSLLGKGGMARVYHGYDEKLDRYAAIKVISGDFATADEEEYKARFQKEARAIARLSHPNIVGVYQFGDAQGVYYMAMHFLDGDDLRNVLRRYAKKGQRMPVEQFLKMGRDMADALDYAHREGVVHRDIKPSNIMMTTDGRAVLTDFGLALSVPEGTMGDTFGTAHYIAPEQAISSAHAVPQSDLYSLAVVFYESLVGQVPFDEPSAMSVALKHLNEPPPPPSLLNPEIPKEVERVLLKALNKDPKDRYQTGRDLMVAIEAAFGMKASDSSMNIPLATTPPPRSPLTAPESLESYLRTLEDSSTRPPSRPSQPIPPGYASDMRPPTDFVPPYATSPYPPTLMYPPHQRNNNLLIGGVVVLILLIAAVLAFLVLSSQDNNDSDVAAQILQAEQTQRAIDRTETRIAIEETQTVVAGFTDTPTPTNTATDTPSPTATNTPTETPSPTNTSTATPSPTVTNTPTETSSPTEQVTVVALPPTATPLPPQLRLVYNDEWLAIVNITEEPLEVTNLKFVLTTEDGNQELELSRFFPASQTGALAPNDCFQLVAAQDIANDTGALRGICRRQAWAAPGRGFIFWVSDDPATTQFQVLFSRGGRERSLTTCEAIVGIDERNCEFTTVIQRGGDSGAAPAATEVAQVVELTESPTEEIPTNEPTEVPASATPTTEPTEALASPTAEPTEEAIPASATLKVTATKVASTAIPTTVAEDATLKLVYNDSRVYILNISDTAQNISELVFEQQVNGRSVVFRASAWTADAVAQLPPNGCYQLGVSAGAASGTPDDCNTSYGWLQRNEGNQFWRGFSNGSDTFSVLQGDQTIIECELQAGECAFSLP